MVDAPEASIASIGRFHYFRWHSHPLGWGVRDSKTGAVVALGDKNICCAVAILLNDNELAGPQAVDLLRDMGDCIDGGACVLWYPEMD